MTNREQYNQERSNTPVEFDLCQLPFIAELISDELRKAGFEDETKRSRNVLKLAEEVGEFVGAFVRIAGQSRRLGTHEELASEWADVVITAFIAAWALDINPTEAIGLKLRVMFSRGWRDDAAR